MISDDKSTYLKENFSFDLNKKKENLLITESTSSSSIQTMTDILIQKTESEEFKNIQRICLQTFENINQNLLDYADAYKISEVKFNKKGNSYDKLRDNIKQVEQLLSIKDCQVMELKRRLSEASLPEKKEKMKEVIQYELGSNTLTAIYEKEKDDLLKEKNSEIKNLKKIIEEANQALTSIKGMDEKLKNQLYEDVKDLSKKNNDLNEKYYMLLNEHNELKKSFEKLSKGIKKGIDFENYEVILHEQFTNMKKSFTKKIEDLNQDLTDMKIDSRRKIYSLEDELKQSNHIKDLFLKQISELKKHNT